MNHERPEAFYGIRIGAQEMTRLLLVCLGGALGSGARYLIALTVPQATLAVNLAGSFAIALVMATLAPSDLRLFLVTGILGGFTTYSAFNEETFTMLRNGAWLAAAAYVLATVLGCLVAGLLGYAAARWVR
jgi:CrcB protein